MAGVRLAGLRRQREALDRSAAFPSAELAQAAVALQHAADKLAAAADAAERMLGTTVIIAGAPPINPRARR